eukprot:86898_1
MSDSEKWLDANNLSKLKDNKGFMTQLPDFLEAVKAGEATTDDINAYATENKLKIMEKINFRKACQILAPAAPDTSNVPDSSKEGYTPTAIDPEQVITKIDVEEKYDVDTDNVKEIKSGVIVDTGITIETKDDDDEKSTDPILRYYDDIHEDSTVDDLCQKMSMYLCETNSEEYVIYKDKERSNSASGTDKIKDIGTQLDKTDDKYTVYAKKKYKPNNGNNESTCNELIKQLTSIRETSKYLAISLSAKNDLIKDIVDKLDTMFNKLDKDPALRTVISLKQAKDTIDKKRKKMTKEEADRLIKQLKFPEPSTLSSVSKWLGLIGSGMSLLAMATSVYAWKQKKNITKWDNEIVKNKDILKDYNKKYVNVSKKVDNIRNAKNKSVSASTRRRIAKGFGRGLKAVGGILSAVQMGTAIADIIIESKKKAEYYEKKCKELNDALEKVYSEYEDMAIMYDGLCDTLWNLKSLYESSFKELCSEKFKNVSNKPKLASVYQQIKEELGTTKKLDILLDGVKDTTTDIVDYLTKLTNKYTECETWLNIKIDDGTSQMNYSEEFNNFQTKYLNKHYKNYQK